MVGWFVVVRMCCAVFRGREHDVLRRRKVTGFNVYLARRVNGFAHFGCQFKADNCRFSCRRSANEKYRPAVRTGCHVRHFAERNLDRLGRI